MPPLNENAEFSGIRGLLSAIATFVGHLLNNFGIRLIGATSASMIGASNIDEQSTFTIL
jgi:drug/metabolite transporter (DMT)-like permease